MNSYKKFSEDKLSDRSKFIGSEKINNKFDISRFIQNDVSTASCSHYQVLS